MVYVDRKDYTCHVTDDGSRIPVETEFFAGKCREFVEGHRCVPEGHSWTNGEGKVFTGPMITPWKDSRILQAAQRQYEENAGTITEMETALKILFEGEEE